jgi:hypothetical protein
VFKIAHIAVGLGQGGSVVDLANWRDRPHMRRGSTNQCNPRRRQGETRCAPACRRKGVSNVHCGAIPSQSSRIQGVPHQHTAFAERNEGISSGVLQNSVNQRIGTGATARTMKGCTSTITSHSGTKLRLAPRHRRGGQFFLRTGMVGQGCPIVDRMMRRKPNVGVTLRSSKKGGDEPA